MATHFCYLLYCLLLTSAKSECLYREITLYGIPYMLIAQVGHH